MKNFTTLFSRFFQIILITLVFQNTSIAQNGKDSLIVSSFWQDGANNCASIALIKAAMLKYGYKNMFSLSKSQLGYKVTLKDLTSFTITNQEMKEAIKFSKFSFTSSSTLGSEKDSVIFYAHIAYASIAKFISTKGHWGCEEGGGEHYSNYKSYIKALKFISKTSFCTDYSYRLLGYKSKDNKIFDFTNPTDINSNGMILFSRDHAVVTYKGFLDCHGDWIPLSLEKSCDNKFEWYIILD